MPARSILTIFIFFTAITIYGLSIRNSLSLYSYYACVPICSLLAARSNPHFIATYPVLSHIPTPESPAPLNRSFLSTDDSSFLLKTTGGVSLGRGPSLCSVLQRASAAEREFRMEGRYYPNRRKVFLPRYYRIDSTTSSYTTIRRVLFGGRRSYTDE